MARHDDKRIAMDFLKMEIRKVGAPPAEIQVAFDLAAHRTAADFRRADALSPRLRRLLDLAIGADGRLSPADLETGACPPPMP